MPSKKEIYYNEEIEYIDKSDDVFVNEETDEEELSEKISLDNLPDGVNYGKVLSTDIVDGHIILSALSGDLDDIADGATYSRVLTTDISAGKILLSAASGDLDDIADGSSYGKVAGTSITAGKIIVAGLDSGVTVRMFTDSATQTNIEAWKHVSDVTKIDGGDIYTGSVTASKITTASLSALSADMGTITAGKIDVGSIEINATTERILFGAATAPLTGIGIFLGKDGANYEFRCGNPAGDFIHWDGSALTIQGTANDTVYVNSIAANIVQPRAETLYKELIFIGNANDGLTETTSSATITRGLLNTNFSIGGQNGYRARISSGAIIGYTGAGSTVIDWDEDWEVVIRAAMTATTDGSAIFLGLVKSTYVPSNYLTNNGDLDAYRSISFYWYSNALYASSSDGTTEETTVITGITTTNFNTYRFVKKSGTIYFYVNDVLKATHNTNVPAGGTDAPALCIGGNSNGQSPDFSVDNNYLVKAS